MKRILLIILLIVFVTSLYPTINRTLEWASNAHGLILLAGLNEDEFTYNPYSKKNIGFISPSHAVWILENMEYPYKNCPPKPIDCDVPLIMWAGRFLGTLSESSEKRIENLIKVFYERGYSLNQNYKGLTALHEAVLFRSTRYVKLLIELGADIKSKVNRPGKEYHNFDVLQFYNYLRSKNPELPNEIGVLLKGENA